MRKILLLLSAALCSVASKAQVVADFENLSLSKADTFYVNYDNPTFDVGFDAGQAHFPCVYDTAWGGMWSEGFAYSNMTDSVTGDFTNMYSAKAGKGYNNSNNYIVAYGGFDNIFKIKLLPAAQGKPVSGFYVTNSTYTYTSMRNGDGFSKQFGGATGNDQDWFKLTIFGYRNGQKTTDSVEFYLADFRDSDNSKDYIVKDWRWVNLLPLGNVDSIQCSLSSTDNGQYGMNTPSYFCVDNFTTGVPTSVKETAAPVAKVYPNPATDKLFIELASKDVTQVSIFDLSGKLVSTSEVKAEKIELNTANLTSGTYFLQLNGGANKATIRFVKQ